MEQLRTRPWLASLGVAAALAALVAWSAWCRWQLLDDTPYPVGIDGWFYAVQLRSILEHAHLQYPASPLAFWLMAPFAWATDPITGAKLGAAVLGALVAVPAYGVGKRIGGSRAAGLFAAALATPSAGSFYLSVEFVKNGVGLTVALSYVWLLLRALESPRPARIAAALVALAATFLAHKMAAGVALVVTVPAIAVEAYARRHARWIVAAALAPVALFGALVGLAVLAPGRTLGGHELDLLGQLWTTRTEPFGPALVLPTRTLWMGNEGLLAGGAALLFVGGLVVRVVARDRFADHPVRPSALAVAAVLAAIGVVIALPWLEVHDPQGLGFRLRIAAFLPMALAAAAGLGLLGALVPRDVRIAVLLVFAAVWVIAQPTWRDEGVVTTHPALAQAVQAAARDLPSDAVIVCPERHIVFMAAWYTRADVRLRPDDVPPERVWRLLPLAFIGKDSPLDRALMAARKQPGLVAPVGLHARHPDGLVLLPEATWDWVVEQLPEDGQARMRRWHTI